MERDLLADLNPSQREAAELIDGPLLILAGAGSGKTKTITSRLAYLIDLVGIPPSNTLTLTFTNKAAGEMHQRALGMLSAQRDSRPLLCTFHRFGLLFLRFHLARLGRKADFILIDSDDRKRILKSINDDLQASLVISEISRMKNWLITPEEALGKAQDRNSKLIASIYEKYEAFLRDKNMVDFDDLLLLPVQILSQDRELALEVSQKYQYVMVDEYQDVNELQYRLLQKLCTAHQNLCVVGDDDQSIYSWRGSNINYILEFADRFQGAKIVKLEENYRSTTPILEAANQLIAFNQGRLGKNLKSIKGEGEIVEILETSDEVEEAKRVASKINALLLGGVLPSQIAVLFRLNALSRSLEESFNRAKIPYRLIGVVRFYERSEIKDVLSYFRLVVNPHDDFSLSRVINRPRRGIGETTQKKLFSAAGELGISVFSLMERAESHEILSKKNHQIISNLFTTITGLQAALQHSTIGFLEVFEREIGLKEAFRSDPEGVDRISNIDELYGVFRDFVVGNPLSGLEEFLQEIPLRSDQDEAFDSFVSCMSVHASKGLEFDHLFVVGLEEGFFPMVFDGSNLEEERRLAYVAFTRAREKLYLSHVHSRFYKGKRTSLLKSRFLKEAGLSKGEFESIRSISEGGSAFCAGDVVMHKIFGMGRILSLSGRGKELKLKINFGGIHREILASYVSKI